MASPSSSSSITEKYPYPSEVKVGRFVPINLSLTNYSIWRQLMHDFIESQGLVGFIDGTIPAPPERTTVPDDTSTNTKMEIDNQDYLEWKKSDLLVRRWISSTLPEDAAVILMRVKSAEELWTVLEKKFSLCFKLATEDELDNEAGKNLNKYLPLHKAALTGDWEKAREFLNQEPDAIRAIITGFSETALAVAVRSAKRNQFVRKLVDLMLPADLAIVNRLGLTALHVAAGVGNIEAAMLLVKKNPELPNIMDKNKIIPLHIAAENGQRKMVCYLLTVTKEDADSKPFEGESGLQLVHVLIFSGYYDIALHFLQRYPKLAQEEPSALLPLSAQRSAFLSRTHFNFWQRVIYSCASVKLENFLNPYRGGELERCSKTAIPIRQKLHTAFWSAIGILVPQIKNIQEKKLVHHQVLELVKCICLEVVKLDNLAAAKVLGIPLQICVCLGIHEMLEEIFASIPGTIFLTNAVNQPVFHDAIVYRQANVFNLIYQLGVGSQIILESPDISMNMGLHLAGFLGPQQRVELRASAVNSALQMQRELQWFKEVEKLTLARDREQRNAEGKTPAMIFTETHEDLVKEAEQWMRDTANSSIFLAALIVTIAFAAAITVPGGNNGQTGLPNFFEEKAFSIFVVSNALSLFSSTSSVIMFLSILTSRYAEEDFLHALPKRLIIGLVSLFLSIISMMIAFSVTLYLVFGNKKEWTLALVAASACLPVTFFAFLQFPQLFDIIKATYFPSTFGKQSDRILF